MSRNKLKMSVVGVALLATSSMVSATEIFDFTPANLGVISSTAYNSVSMTVGGHHSVDVTAFTIANDGNGNISSMTQLIGPGVGVYVSSGNNLGVQSNPILGDSNSLDGGSVGSANDLDEGLLFTFESIVSLDYIDFDSFSGNDDFNLTVDGVLVVADYHVGHSDTAGGRISDIIGQSDEFNFNGISGTEFLFWADSNSDSFRIDQINVPEPMTLITLGLGLFGLGFRRRLKKTS